MKKLWYLLLTLVFGTILIVFFYFLQKDPNLATAILAFATVILAIATLLSIVNTNEQEKHRREDELQKEQRGKEESLLNEIIEWATDVAKSAVSRQTMAQSELWKTKLEYKYFKAKSRYIIEVASSSFDDLSPFITSVITKLDKAIEVTTQFIERRADGKSLVQYETELTECVEKLITEIARIKTGDIVKKEENMPKEGEPTPRNEITLKDIEEHLQRQDKQTAKGAYLTGAAVGASIILVAVSLWVGKFVSSLFDFYWQYIFLLIVGFWFMFWCWWKQSKVK